MENKLLGYMNLIIIVLNTEDISDILPPRESDFVKIKELVFNILDYRQFRSVLALFGLGSGKIKSLEDIKRVLNSKSQTSMPIRLAVQLLIHHNANFRANFTRTGLEKVVETSKKEIANLKDEGWEIEHQRRQAEKLLDINRNILHYRSKTLEEARDKFVSNLFSADIEVLELSVRAERCLRENVVNKVIDLTRKTKDELIAYPQFGRKCLNEVLDILHDSGLGLAKEPYEPPPFRSPKPEHHI